VRNNRSQSLASQKELQRQYKEIRREILSIINAITVNDLDRGGNKRMKK